MKTKYFFLAAIAATALASCSNDEFLGDLSPNVIEETTGDDGVIKFGFELPNTTRGDIGGNAAAALLGNHFYVTGTKGTEQETSPTTNLVFDNYLVRYTANTAGTTESNTANWEYVGVVPGTGPDANYVKLGDYLTGTGHSGQTIKYWDYSQAQYDFFGFSTGTYAAVSGSSTGTTNIGVTAMKYGTDLENSRVAYTFDIPSLDAIRNTYITDITEVTKANYGNDVTLKFKNIGSKVRVALYETVPGYSVKDVVFYTEDGTDDFTDDKSTTNGEELAALISANATGLPTKGTIEVYFPNVGTDNEPNTQNYDKAAATVSAVTANSVKYMTFGPLDNLKGADKDEDGTSDIYLGRSLTDATFAGDVNADYYQTVFPVSGSDPLTLRIDYKLVAIDGSGEEITVKAAKAVVPSQFTVWLPNYAYTYIFKISDNTNGWTGPASDPQGLFPITFDAVVAEATDATGEQTTITTVAAPTITTYQQGHDYLAGNEYDHTGKKLYVQVMDNRVVPATLVNNLNGETDDGTKRSLLFSLSENDATEAKVMDALQKRMSAAVASDATIVGRNGITLTKNANIDNTVDEIENGVDNNKIENVTAGTAAEINIANLSAGTYAYVYDYTDKANNALKTVVTEFQPIAIEDGATTVGEDGKTYYKILKATLAAVTDVTQNDVSNNEEEVDPNYIYFSKTTTDGGTTYTYSYISVAGKETLPEGLLKVAKSTVTSTFTGGSAIDNTVAFYFEKYFTNDGLYAVKVIKVY